MLGLAVALLAQVSAEPAIVKPPPPVAPAATSSATALEKPPSRVYAGVYLADVSEFNLKEGRFKADLYLWMKWLGGPAPPPVSIANAEIEKKEEEVREEDGDWRSVRQRIQGTFRGTFPLQRFPFDTHRLRIDLELPEAFGQFLPDLAGSGMAPRFSITGWLYEPYFSAERGPATYASDFGAVRREGQPHRVNGVTFVLTLQRPFMAYIVKFLLPLAIIVAASMLVFFVPAKELEVRGGLGVTALLACLAFHLAQADTLPSVPYLVTADYLFLGAYVLILVSIAESVVSYNLYDGRVRASRSLDRVAWMTLPPLALLLAGLVLVLAARDEPRLVAAPATPRVADTTRRELRVALRTLPNLNIGGLHGLLRRGLVHWVTPEQAVPHLAVEVPDLTNEYVRFLPDGGMRVRWRLRPNLRWSDGQAITGQDLLFSAGLVANEDRRGLRLIDDHTVDIDFARRHPASLDAFTVYPRTPELAERFAKEGYDGLWKLVREKPPPGDGPYMLEAFAAGKRAVFRRNPHFAGQPPALERIVVEVPVGDPATLLKEGRIDLVPVVSLDSLGALAGTGVSLRTESSDFFYFLQPDVTTAPFADLRVRQAILHALDRQTLARMLEGEHGRVAHSYRPEAAADHAAGVARYAHDPPRARALLAAAGLRAPIPIRLIALEARPDTARGQTVALIARELAAVGFAVTRETVKGTLELYLKGTHGGLLFFTRDDTSVAARFWNVPYARGRFEVRRPQRLFDPDVVKLYDQYDSTLFVERRRALSQRLQVEWARRLPILPLVFGADVSAHAPELVGWQPTARNVWWNLEQWRFR